MKTNTVAIAALPDRHRLHAAKAALTRQHDDACRAIEAAEKNLGRGYMAQAEGHDTQAAERRDLLELELQKRTIENHMREADADLAAVEQRDITRTVMKTWAAAIEHVDARVRLTKEVDGLVWKLVSKLDALQDHGGAILGLLRGIRGRNTLTDQGWIAGASISDVINPSNLQFLLERHIVGAFPGWRSEFGAGPAFGVSMGSQNQVLRHTIDELLGMHNLDPAHVAAIEAEQGEKQVEGTA